MNKNKSFCFLSYAREDSEKAQSIYNFLINQGIEIWFDQESLLPGAKWKIEINKAIRNSRYFLVLLSENSVSKKGFVQKEIKEAIEILKEYPDDEIYIIPIRLDNCHPSNELLLDLNWIDLFEDYTRAMDRLVQFLRIEMTVDKLQMSSQLRPKPSLIKFNGLYQSEERDGYWYYLRFYDDGVVLSASITGDNVTNIAKWFNRDSVNSSRGIFQADGESVQFSCSSSNGTVNYKGRVLDNGLALNHHSLINGYRAEHLYRFIEF